MIVALTLIVRPEAAGQEPPGVAGVVVTAFMLLFVAPPLWPAFVAIIDAARAQRWGWLISHIAVGLVALIIPVLGSVLVATLISGNRESEVSDIVLGVKISALYLIVILMSLVSPAMVLLYFQPRRNRVRGENPPPV
jgi:hypothetical protein